MTLRRRLLAATALAALLTAPAVAADLEAAKAPPAPPVLARRPAVDGVNGKFEGFGGWADWRDRARRSNGSAGWLGSLSAPLGESFGVQVDALAASHRSSFVGGGGGHLFWRDPSVGLLGGYGTVVHNDRFNDTRYRVGGEGALYYGPFSLTGIAGYEQGSAAFLNTGFVPGAVTFDALRSRGRFFDMVDASYYATENIKFSVGHRYVGGRHAAAMGGEAQLWSFDAASASVFVEGRVGEGDYKGVWAGLRLYFGQSHKSLMHRHREDDPPNWLKDDMFAAQNGRREGVLIAPPAAATVAPPPPPPPPPPCPCGPCYPAGS